MKVLDQEIVNEAINSGLSDFEDALQAFAGRKAGATHVATRDARGFQGGPLTVVSPIELISAASGAAEES